METGKAAGKSGACKIPFADQFPFAVINIGNIKKEAAASFFNK
jgi:hypothetical protein